MADDRSQIEFMFSSNVYVVSPGRDDEAATRDAVRDAVKTAFEAEPEVRSRDANSGRGADAGAVIVELLAVGAAVFYGGGKLLKLTRESAEEWSRVARRLDLPTRLSGVVSQLRGSDRAPIAVSWDVAAAIALHHVERATGAETILVWADQLVLQPMEWAGDLEGVESSAERLYFFVIDRLAVVTGELLSDDRDRARVSRFFVATKADGTIITSAETYIPRDYVDYFFWGAARGG